MTETASCTLEEKRAALEHALASKTFSRAEQLRAFLRFVCEAEIEGRAADLTEYVIGVEVLGRPKDYSPAEDSSVRTRAYELRQKLQKLYAIELPHEPVQIVIAKGAYTPQYIKPEVDHPVEPMTTTPLPHPLLEGPGSRGEAVRPRWRALALLAVGAVCGSALTVALVKTPTAIAAVDPVVLEAWRPLVRPDANVLLCAATPLNLTVGPEGHQAYGSPTYPAPPETYPLFRQHRPLAAGAKLGLLFTDNLLGVGTMNAVVTAANTLRALGVSYQILPERVATLSALRGRNAILFGAPVDSEAITRITESVPLTVDFEPSVNEFVIRDRSNGSMIVPQKDSLGDFVDVYGLVTVLNTRESDRGRLGMVVFSGITSAGTQGAAEFFASAHSLRRLRSIFAHEGMGGFPAAYQVVVKCTFNNLLLVAYEYRLHKVLQKE
ncbi:MAG TPA: hypothetical protein VKB88_40285 [Bryobacteraceae bacterium]|nr:hypothetical protein [Bryobacteraceae bacterium]